MKEIPLFFQRTKGAGNNTFGNSWIVIHFPVTQNKMPAGRIKKINLKIYDKIYVTRAFYIIIYSNNNL